jgi:hypothetical protein
MAVSIVVLVVVAVIGRRPVPLWTTRTETFHVISIMPGK